MKKYTKIGVFLVSLFPFISGCQRGTEEYPTLAEKEKPEYSPPVKRDGHPGSGDYEITQTGIPGVRPSISFTHYELEEDKFDVMLVIKDVNKGYLYIDYKCDGIVDIIDLHRRGDLGTEDMFEYANKVFEKWKKELHEKPDLIKVREHVSRVEHESVKK